MSEKLDRRGFLVLGAAASLAAAGGYWLATRDPDGQLSWPLRRALESHEALGRKLAQGGQARELPDHQAQEPPVNGRLGLDASLDPATWSLSLRGPQGSRLLTLDELTVLPPSRITTELHCVEGWSAAVTWVGVRVADLMARPPLQGDSPYASLSTPDGAYYVGLDAESLLHPQTLLAYGMNGARLSPAHGSPLRLVVPVKYGYKWLKRVGSLSFGAERPPDYWAERGYDWYAGL